MSVGSIGSVAASSAAASTRSASSVDPRDLNGDGKVTEAEIQAYARIHPTQTKSEAGSAVQGGSPLDLYA